MKILHVTDSLRSGGKERQLLELLTGISARNDTACELLVISQNIHSTAVNGLDIEIHHLIRKSRKDPTIFLRLYRLCRAIQPDIIHSWNSMTSIYAVPVAKLLGIRFVNGIVRNAPLQIKPFSKIWLRSKLTFPFSEVILSNSYAGLRSYHVPEDKGVCVHNGFNVERINNMDDREAVIKRLNITTDKVVGMVASFSRNKDYVTFIDAAISIFEHRDDVTFVMVGGGENLEACKRQVPTEFRKQIKFLGKQQDVESIINIFDIGVLATYAEGISNSIMEYMALGKPAVATDGGGTSELVINERTGFLVPPRDKGALASKIERLLDDKDLRMKMGTEGKTRLLTDFSLDKMIHSFVEIYSNLV